VRGEFSDGGKKISNALSLSVRLRTSILWGALAHQGESHRGTLGVWGGNRESRWGGWVFGNFLRKGREKAEGTWLGGQGDVTQSGYLREKKPGPPVLGGGALLNK